MVKLLQPLKQMFVSLTWAELHNDKKLQGQSFLMLLFARADSFEQFEKKTQQWIIHAIIHHKCNYYSDVTSGAFINALRKEKLFRTSQKQNI